MPGGRRRHGIATACLSGLLEDKLAAAAAAGFDGVELFVPDLLGSPEPPGDVARRCADLGLAIDLYQPIRDVEALPPDAFAAALRRVEHAFDVMERLGTTTALICSSVDPRAVDDDELAARQLAEVADRAADRGLRIAYEALAWGRHVNTWDHSWRIVELADHPALGLCVDSFHLYARGGDPSGLRDVPGEKIFFLQLADAPRLDMDVLPWSRHHRLFPGQGDFDLTALVRHLDVAGYDGPWSLEVFNDVFRQADPGPAAVDARRSLLGLGEALAGLPAVDLGGTAFVELAADPDTCREVTDALAAFGFARTGEHRSKPVGLWEAGGARVVVREEAAPGPAAVAALAVRTPDPEALARRGTELLAPRVPLPHAGDEAELRAVAAPDGTLLFCCPERPEPGADDFWPGDFRPTGMRPATGQVLGIDHVALSPPFDLTAEAELFLRTVVGLGAVGPQSEVVAPFGVVRSRLFASPGPDPVRVVLSSSLVRRGGWAPGVPAPQSVAFAVDDVLAVSRAARAAGLALLGVGPNYYEDLAARGVEDVDGLAEHRVLVDVDPSGGQYRHVVTPVLGGRVFLEAVQRVGGHAGHGAADAPVRMAAQRRARIEVSGR
ncbi:sugar phosphate isomerase/epimerase and 4-hydroxyphenylpyruvate domain-containing protein [Actinomycetospora termitidis]|uniref:3-dehydroshikimate dehydratase n=1 Tax=Actinomycetospora termitidis TaxID=3053470 RepID=A0ABT7M6G6_9PSEU|nr:sugar phosphate isomerase/epimerase and 4-hydroxyphenylpyruvate domain-containing protein [Actinomycetospora sp. Odt1-22]MDL5156262.1 TIM barrel protein [Actinomycetospora sp. Odt1-22]